MIRWLILAAAVVARLGGAPNLAVTPKRVADENRVGKFDSVEEAPALVAPSQGTGTQRRTRSFHISKKFIEDGVDDQRSLRSAETIAPTPITYEPTAAPHVPTPAPTYEPTYMPTYKPSARNGHARRKWGGRKHTGSWSRRHRRPHRVQGRRPRLP